MNELKTYLNNLIPFTESEMEVFVSLFSKVEYKKHDYFAKEGSFSSKLAFISTGVMRAFFRNKAGNEYNKNLFYTIKFCYGLFVYNNKAEKFN